MFGVLPHQPHPRPLAVWGLIGYAVILVGSVMQILGFHLNSVQAVPGGLWEVFIGVWLLVKGFNPSAITRTADHVADDARCGLTSCRERRLILGLSRRPAPAPGAQVRARTVARWDHVPHEHA